jgi:predicted RNA-binding protein with PUA-like domain
MDANKCIQFLSWFEGDLARPWADGILSTIGTRNESRLLRSWPMLLEAGATLWGPINEEFEARNQLREIKQTDSVSGYHAKFLRWAIISKFNEEALVDSFYRGLKESIKNMMTNIPRPQTLQELLSAALEFESRILERVKERKQNENRPRYGQGQTATADIKATRLSPEERTKRMKEGRCFTCNRSGHISRNCPDKEKIKTTSEEIPKEEKKEETKEEKDF